MSVEEDEKPEEEEEEDDILGQIDWDNLCDADNLFFDVGPTSLATDSSSSKPSTDDCANPSPVSVSSWIGEIEHMLMNDRDDDFVDPQLQSESQSSEDNFMAGLLVDSPYAADVSTCDEHRQEEESEKAEDKEENKLLDDVGAVDNNDVAQVADDPISKKLRRQLRNRDAAVRSRERKKMYVKDLEMKSKYLEAECRRLGRLLQCFVAENQALRLSLQKGSAFGVTSAKQESAVLLLESLLLGSLLWFVGIICLFALPTLPPSALVAVPPESEGETVPEIVNPRRAGSSKNLTSLGPQSYLNSRRCKASRTRIRPGFLFLRVLV